MTKYWRVVEAISGFRTYLIPVKDCKTQEEAEDLVKGHERDSAKYLIDLDEAHYRNNVYSELIENEEDELHTRITELKAVIDQLIEAGEKMQALIGWSTGDEATKDWDALVKDWKEG